MPKFSIVMTAYNEAKRIAATLTHIRGFMPEFSPDYEIIVNDDGSTDSTVEVVRKYMEDAPEIRLLCNPHRGKGPGVWAAVMAAEGDYIYMVDVDMSTPIEELKKLFVWLSDHDYDIVIASREGTGAQRIKEPFYRHLMGRVFNMLVQIFALPGIKDSQCGFKLFKKDVAKEVFSRLVLYGEHARQRKHAYLGAFDVEVLFIARKLGYTIKAVPVVWKYAKTTRLHVIRDSINMARDVLHIRFNALIGKYKFNKSPAQKSSATPQK